MEHVRWTARPKLERPVMLAAFEGWNDAGDAATTAVGFLRDQWGAEPFADIDPEEFFDFTAQRPEVVLVEGITRTIEWPTNQFFHAKVPANGQDVVLLLGIEPGLRWRTFCRQIADMAAHFDARLVVTMGSLLAEVAHSKPVSVIGTAVDQELIDRLGLQRSRYEGPTGIVGVLHDALGTAGRASGSLWAAVPSYVPAAPSPKAALALVHRVAQILDVDLPVDVLAAAAVAYEQQVSDLVNADDETSDYVRRLEEAYQPEVVGEPTTEPVSVEDLMRQVEQYLRDQDD